ncbi:uncharacterized protein LOC120184185 [Hibiscus syriacus]|uniref:uncharacterized protein LOC120184185 n=1 Tax=Hibiscus syriacus TaxID=106335 RepID=UPI001923AA52|nr:uncharacterized protein LOC120184185 [Hibiscus syriacus]
MTHNDQPPVITADPAESYEVEPVPIWWLTQQSTWEQRMQLLEATTTDTKNMLQQLLGLMQKAGAESGQSTPAERPQAPTIQIKDATKVPLQVTVLDDKEKYSFQPEQQGILASKPTLPQDVFKMKTTVNTTESGEQSVSKGHPFMEKYSSNNNTGMFLPKPKIELQFFDGTNPRSWIRKCEKYFSIFVVPELQKLEIAAMYFTGKAEVWFDGYIMKKSRVTWHEFVSDMCHRFADKGYIDVIDEFNKLTQLSSVEEYEAQFEELQPYLLQINPELGDEYFVSSFLSGLKEELKHKVKVLEPKTVAEAARKAKLYELAAEVESKKFRSISRPMLPGNFTSSRNSNPSVSSPLKNSSGLTPNRQQLLDYRRANNLCYKCGDKFTPGHHCKLKQLNSMEEVEEQEEAEELQAAQNNINKIPSEEKDPEISMNAITGSSGSSTLRIQGFIKGKPLSILIDSGSTHSLVTNRWAKEGQELEETNPLVITVANGDKLYSTSKSKQLSWEMQDFLFAYDFRVLPLGGSDMVLGVDWMKKYSPVLMDFNNMTLSFKMGDQEIVLRGGLHTTAMRIISSNKMQKLMIKNPEAVGEIYMLNAEIGYNEIPPTIQAVIADYRDVFEEPTGMPPIRKHDHSIILKSGIEAVNVKPYRMPYHQKSEVEKQVAEMLAASIIQTSKSPFASPCLLVKKKDGSWRMCIDYRQLNALTVKNKFPIPVVDDLLDELVGAKFFSKLDLRSGYWQIRIRPEDIPKTAFRTHHGHFEFKLRIVLEILRQNKLFAKRTKCFFGQSEVEYLGYTISPQGVATDSSKIQAIKEWSIPRNLKSLRGFLGLTGYYRKFIRSYGEIKTDASSKGIGAVLSQEGRPIAYLSKALGPKQIDLSIYEKEYIAILMAISKWRHYLEGSLFVIKTDHESLKHLQFEDKSELNQLSATIVIPAWVQEVENSYEQDSLAKDFIPKLLLDNNSIADWSYAKGVLRYKGKVYVGETGGLRQQILSILHDSPQGGHSGIHATYYRLKLYFY